MSSAAAESSSLTWNQICNGKMGSEWYGTDEARIIADRVVYLQHTNGGWMKNIELHRLTDQEVAGLYADRSSESCLDNNATTQEMNFLALVYAATGIESYRESFARALSMILSAQKSNGGWSQYWPLRGPGYYHDYITFNDNLMTNVLKILQSVAGGQGGYAGLVDDSIRQKCSDAFNRGIDLIIRCQVDDNGTPSAWCAQHDNTTLLPAEGRPFELPSISGYESSSLLSFLMSIEQPSSALKDVIRTAVRWLDAHRIPDKALETYTNDEGLPDARIVDRPGRSLWARFIQLGGPAGEAVYNDFFKKLRDRGKSRSYVWQGKKYTYPEYQIAQDSYDPAMAYQPIYSMYDTERPHIFYRFLYNYEDSEPVENSDGIPLPTSLSSGPRTSYQFMGSWGENLIDREYPEWERRMLSLAESDGYELCLLSKSTYIDSDISGSDISYNFRDGISLSNHTNRQFAEGARNTNTIKYSKNTEYSIHLPEGMQVSRIRITGYNNYANNEAYILNCNGNAYSPSDYIFPTKDGDGNPTTVSHMIDFSNPVTGDIRFTLGGNQCALIITLYSPVAQSGMLSIPHAAGGDDDCHDLQGHKVDPTNLRPGIYLRKGSKFIVR
ncbi:MAG: pectate lyase [Duncaniella sp.]|nr:pectate lyase [Duncaniella sp.]